MGVSRRVSASLQDYLEAILELDEEQDQVRITDLAVRLNVSKPSANQAMNNLARLGLIDQERYGPIQLTEEGRQQAVKVRRRHRIIRRFLTEVLDVPPDIAERDACLVEHAVSPVTMDKLVEFLVKRIEIDPGAESTNDSEEPGSEMGGGDVQ